MFPDFWVFFGFKAYENELLFSDKMICFFVVAEQQLEYCCRQDPFFVIVSSFIHTKS